MDEGGGCPEPLSQPSAQQYNIEQLLTRDLSTCCLVVCSYQCNLRIGLQVSCCDPDQICHFSKVMCKSGTRTNLRRGSCSTIYAV